MQIKVYMTFKIIAGILLLLGLKWLFDFLPRQEDKPEEPIDQAWWDGLSDEWKDILRINQYFQQHQVDFYAVQQAYLQRMNANSDSVATAFNTPLREWLRDQTYMLSYQDLYKRVQKEYPESGADSINLNSLATLERLYMVSGPGDLTPLRKLPKLKVLIANYCGINHALPTHEQVLNLEPIRKLHQLEELHAVTPALKTLEPVKGLINLKVLHCQNSDITTLDPIKKLTKLEHLAFGAKVEKASVLGRLNALKTLHISGCKQIPDLSGLKDLQQLSIVESELALVNRSYRINSLDFLTNLRSLEVLDIELTSYRGSLEGLKHATQLKAVTLPRVSTADLEIFKQTHKDCYITNGYAW